MTTLDADGVWLEMELAARQSSRMLIPWRRPDTPEAIEEWAVFWFLQVMSMTKRYDSGTATHS